MAATFTPTEAAAQAIFFNQGQVSTAGSRLYVHDAIYDDVVDAVAEQARRIVIGPGSDPATEMGPLVSARHHDRVSSYIESGPQHGARLARGRRRPAPAALEELLHGRHVLFEREVPLVPPENLGFRPEFPRLRDAVAARAM